MPAGNLKENSITESEAMVWQQTINSLTAADVGIEDAFIRGQFKNILTLHTYELFYARQLWRSQHKDFIFPLLRIVVKSIIKLSAYSPLVQIYSNEELKKALKIVSTSNCLRSKVSLNNWQG